MKLTERAWQNWLALALSFFIPFLVYFMTMCRVISPYTLGDSGELGTAVYVLGIPHPPGYPLYTIICSFFGTIFCFSSPIVDYNFTSAIFASLTISLVYLIGNHFTNYKSISLGAALSLAFLPVFWAQATIAEVYTIYTFFLALIVYYLVVPLPNKTHFAYLIAFLYGVSISHHLIMVILLPSLLLWAIYYYRDTVFRWRVFTIILTLALLGVFLYSILSIRANANPPSRWPLPQNFKQLIDHVTARTYKEMFFSSTASGEASQGRFTFILKFFYRQVFPLFYLIGIGGMWLLGRENKPLFWFLVLLIIFDLLYSQFINVGDILAVGLATFMVIVLAIAKAVDYLVTYGHSRFKYGLLTACCLLYLFPLASVAVNYHKQDLSQTKNQFKIEEYTRAFYLFEQGEKVYKGGEKLLAFKFFDEAARVGYYLDWLQLKIAAYNLQEKRYLQARQNYQFLLKLNPRQAAIYSQLAYTYELTNELSMAIENYQKAITLAPRILDNYLNISLVYDRQKEYNLELQIIKQAYILAPDNVDVNFHLARALEHNNQEAEAVTTYQKIITRNAEYLPAYYNLALLLEKSSSSTAITYWKIYLEKAKGKPAEKPYVEVAAVHLNQLGGGK